jgi:TPR repeat protein
MKKTFISTFLFGLISIQAHADYVAQPQSVATQAARYSVMSISELQSAAKAGQAGAQFYLATRYQYGKDVAKDENKLLLCLKQQQIKVYLLHS